MSTRRKGKWGPRGKGPNGRALCYCGCGEELGADMKRRTSMPGHYEKWAAVNDAKTVRRLVYERDHGVCAGCGVDTERRAREAYETVRLVRWLARRHAEDLIACGELPFYPGFTPSEKRYAAYIQQHEHQPSRWGDVHRWTEHWTREEMDRRFGEAISARSGHTWEADHIIPVVEGGGECGLENYRTLCLPCHRKETAALARRRAERRKPKPAGILELSLA